MDLAKPKSEAAHSFHWYLLISENTLIEVIKYGIYGRERRKKNNDKDKIYFPL